MKTGKQIQNNSNSSNKYVQIDLGKKPSHYKSQIGKGFQKCIQQLAASKKERNDKKNLVEVAVVGVGTRNNNNNTKKSANNNEELFYSQVLKHFQLKLAKKKKKQEASNMVEVDVAQSTSQKDFEGLLNQFKLMVQRQQKANGNNNNKPHQPSSVVAFISDISQLVEVDLEPPSNNDEDKNTSTSSAAMIIENSNWFNILSSKNRRRKLLSGKRRNRIDDENNDDDCYDDPNKLFLRGKKNHHQRGFMAPRFEIGKLTSLPQQNQDDGECVVNILPDNSGNSNKNLAFPIYALDFRTTRQRREANRELDQRMIEDEAVQQQQHYLFFDDENNNNNNQDRSSATIGDRGLKNNLGREDTTDNPDTESTLEDAENVLVVINCTEAEGSSALNEVVTEKKNTAVEQRKWQQCLVRHGNDDEEVKETLLLVACLEMAHNDEGESGDEGEDSFS